MSGIPFEVTCREIVELVTSYLESRLSEEDRTRFELHLVFCNPCRTYVQQMRQVLATTGKLTEESVPAGVRDSLLQAFRSWKARGGGA